MLQEIGVETIISAASKAEGLATFKSFQPDVCLIDVELSPGQKDGGDLAFEIRRLDMSVPIIFVTSYFKEDYYEYVKPVSPSSFLDKKLSRLKLLQALELAWIHQEKRRDAPKSAAARPLEHSTPKSSTLHAESKQIFFRVGDSLKPFNLDEIDFFYAHNGSTNARVKGRNFPTNTKLKVLADELWPKFLRCHKAYVVNVNHIDSVLIKEGKVKVGDSLITIGYAYRKKFFKDLNLLK
jgi:DNA-binding LytR/AlgR family response regulator